MKSINIGLPISFLLIIGVLNYTDGISTCSGCLTLCADIRICYCEMPVGQDYCTCVIIGGVSCNCECYSYGHLVDKQSCDCPKPNGDDAECPFVFGWTGENYETENSLLSASEWSNGLDVTDYYLFNNPLEIYGENLFYVILYDYDTHTFLDRMRLLAVDHPETLNIGTTFDEKILAWSLTKAPDFCVDNYGNNQLAKILHDDGDCWIGEKDDYLLLGFIGVDTISGWGNGAAFLSNIEGEGNLAEYRKLDRNISLLVPPGGKSKAEITRMGYEYSVLARKNIANQCLGHVYERSQSSYSLVDLAPYYSFFPETLSIKVAPMDFIAFDQIQLTNAIDSLMIVQECTLCFAYRHEIGDSIMTDVLQVLLEIDSNYVEIYSPLCLNLGFNPPSESCPSGWKRDFVLVSTGRYEEYQPAPAIKEVSKKTEITRFNLVIHPTYLASFSEIRYALSHRSKILLKVYDPTGTLKVTLEDGLRDPGRYSILWDGTDNKGERLPPGTYFVKLQAEGYTQTEKLVIVR